jgi:hypothetical protein
METPEAHKDVNDMADENGLPPSLRSESDLTITEKCGAKEAQMSRLHDIAFIFTICMAQILALSGLGMALCRLP